MTREAQIEEFFIKKLEDLKYVYRKDIRDKYALERNFREKFEILNNVKLTDNEFERLKADIIHPDVFTASKVLRTRNYFQREDGTSLHYTLVNIRDWCKNEYEVINQLRMNTDKSSHRYDVMILINGIPIVQVELKTLELSPRNAMQQIVDYKNDAGNGYTNSLLCFVQLFIVSNKTNTYYFANNRNQHFSFNADEQFLPVYQYADEQNKKVTHIDSFAEKFLPKCTLGELISKYMVLVEGEQKMLVMRPYQIYAVKAIVDCIQQNRGNGYIWHTTGSGKTLTSFKASTLLKDNPDIEKCLFVVDRKDLDRQTREEFNKFQEGSVETNTNTEALVRRLLSTDYADKVIVTTIQKLGLALDDSNRKNYKERLQPLSSKRVVFIFDECHRSQFGENHKAIKAFFPHAQLFGFTGTPIFTDNSGYTVREGEQAFYRTTEDIFEKQLHAYTITHAIEDKNVLRFHIDYYKGQGSGKLKPGETLARQAVAEAILKKHDASTNNRRFNAILATASISNAIEYYRLFKEMQQKKKNGNPDYEWLNITCVFSPPAEGNKDIQQIQEDLEQEKLDNRHNPDEKKAALKMIIEDYNRQYHTNHSIYEFDAYYQDVQRRIKNHQFSNADEPHKNKIDITIVVDMLLTGFDSKYLNTLYVDKNLKYHGLIQAFSRTNRVLTGNKPHGSILDFRQQQEAVNAAISLFSGEDAAARAKEIWLVEPAPVVIEKYRDAVANLDDFMKKNGLECEPHEVFNLKGDAAKIAFLKNFKEVQRLKTQLDQYTDLDNGQKEHIDTLLPEDSLRSFRSSYMETAKQFRKRQQEEGENTPADVQQLDFEFILFASTIIDYDYIMSLIAENMKKKPAKQKMTKMQVISLLTSSSNMMEEQEDLTEYINALDWNSGQDEHALRSGYQIFKIEKSNRELLAIATRHHLPAPVLKDFIDEVLKRMIFDGERLTDLLEPLQLSWKERRTKELSLMSDLLPHLKKQAQGREISGLAAYE
ncbi:type I restriction endonuclease subunit R [uncultured Chryseobacterium sp.]|uniref:type I restriction endonuclease subunit R n=1 Tax=uncultured Chryseobacterium sp. TaxID=259322 RepID=UPI0025E035BD|nr:type I restriction endonuclease subunit R [uncultured Chryseobacterium sp.]